MDNKEFDLWSKHFHKYLFEAREDIGYKDGNRVKHIELMQDELHKVFEKLVIHSHDSQEAEKTFRRVRTLALHLLDKDDKALLKEAYDLGVRKNHDYGTNNILLYGVVGIIVRINDKLSRVKNLYVFEAKKLEPKVDEKIEDTLLDVVNYSTYALMLLNNVWS